MMTKIYTKSGDCGTTQLIGGKRVAKHHPQVEAYGTVDELSAHIAMLGDLLAICNVTGYREDIVAIQKALMSIEAILASDDTSEEVSCGTPEENYCSTSAAGAATSCSTGAASDSTTAASRIADIDRTAVEHLEHRIDQMSATLPALTHFTLPGGHIAVSECHICRTVCRRAERTAMRLEHHRAHYPNAYAYLNRLSDYLYTAGRSVGQQLGATETLWEP